MIDQIARAACKERERAGLSRAHIAVQAGKSTDAVEAFEKGRSWRAIDQMLSAYARALEVDERDLVERALQEWREDNPEG